MPPKIQRGVVKTQLDNEDYKKEGSKQVSDFSITLNPNISSTPGTSFHRLIHAKMFKISKYIFANDDPLVSDAIWKKLIKFRYKPTHSYNENIFDITPKSITVEYDNKKHKWHLQALVSIEHNSNVQLDYDTFVGMYGKALNQNSGSISCKIRGQRNLEDYANKTQKT